MKKALLIAIAAMGVAMGASAQITEAQATAKTIKVGNRPTEGSFGLYIGGTTSMFKSIGSSTKVYPLPLLNFKYMKTDNLELRLGVEMYKERTSQSYDVRNEEDALETTTMKNSQSYYRFTPGVAYHFNSKNILDVYAGAEALVGWQTDKEWTENKDGNTTYGRGALCSMNLGGGAFVGLQAFIGDLPLAVGVEYGIQGIWYLGQTYTVETADGARYTPANFDMNLERKDGAFSIPDGAGQFEDYTKTSMKLGQQVRFTLSYYFNR